MFSKESNGKGIASKTYALSSPTSRLNKEVLNNSASIRRSAAGGDVQIHGGSEDEGWYSTIMRSSNSLWVILGISLAGGIAASAIIFFRSRRHRQTSKDFGAFVKYLELLPPPQPATPIAPHPLTGLTFAIKDNFDVESFITGFGLPDWEKTHEPASFTAHAVETLVQAGATCIGKTQMDIMGCSLSGQNTHYEPLINPATSVHIPGGSSGGSAVAVSAGLVDFALGTDTNGDVRLPAALCEVLGIRSSHGFIPCTGVVPVAKSLDTVGWFAKDSKVLYKVGQVLLRSQVSEVNRPKRVLVADDCFRFLSVSENRCLSVAINAIEKAYGRQTISHIKLGEYFASKMSGLKTSLVSFPVDGEKGKAERGFTALRSLSDACRVLQCHQFKLNHEDWIRESLAANIPDHVKSTLETNSELVSESLTLKNEACSVMAELLMNDTLLLIPTVASPPPKLRSKSSIWADFEEKSLTLLCVVSMSGCCQVSIPVGRINGYPSAVSLIAKQGADLFLLSGVDKLFPVLQKELETHASSDHEDDQRIPMPEAAEAAKEKGNEAFRKKDFKSAISSYSEAIEYDDGNATYYSNRGAAYLALSNFHSAEKDCTRAIDLDKKNVKAFLRRATARESLGSYKEADEDFRQALVLEPTNKVAADGLRRLKKLLFG